MSGASPREHLICTVADLLQGCRTIAVGASSPIPAAAAMLHRARAAVSGRPPVRISILGSVRHNFFTNGSAELFDSAAQGRIDAFFLGGGQIDGQGNINLVGTAPYPRSPLRWPGSFGSSFLYFMVPKVILFREDHDPRVLVDRVDFISAPGTSEPHVARPGGPHALVTGKALFRFDRDAGRFELSGLHPGHDLEAVRAATGFGFRHAPVPPVTPAPDAESLSLLRGPVRDTLAESYPGFAAQLQSA
ncbi:MAG: CoA synthetase [Rhodobacteraceae bacterium]|nr:CoA synthetase [Paracoccaceae bacterium]